jgi:hypothetical protein
MLAIELTAQDVERFWNLVEKRGDDECWLYKGFRDKDGYGMFSIPSITRTVKTGPHKGHNKWVTVRSNRVAFKIANDAIDSRMVLHSCDNPPCCNPFHLRQGTNEQNAQERDDKKRSGWITKPEQIKRGEHAGRAKLTESQVLDILESFHNGRETVTQLRKRFSVDHKSIRLIIHRINWKHVQFTKPTSCT